MDERFEFIMDTWKRLTGNGRIEFDNAARSERFSSFLRILGLLVRTSFSQQELLPGLHDEGVLERFQRTP